VKLTVAAPLANASLVTWMSTPGCVSHGAGPAGSPGVPASPGVPGSPSVPGVPGAPGGPPGPSQATRSPSGTRRSNRRMTWSRPLLVPSRSATESRIRRRTCGCGLHGGRTCGFALQGHLRISSTTSVMMNPTVIVVHMITCRGTVHASLVRLVSSPFHQVQHRTCHSDSAVLASLRVRVAARH